MKKKDFIQHFSYHVVTQACKDVEVQADIYGFATICHLAIFLDGALYPSIWKLFSDEASIFFRRFAKVFEQTYTRFLDLQKAEAQARESQIQLALERVRARTMACSIVMN